MREAGYKRNTLLKKLSGLIFTLLVFSIVIPGCKKDDAPVVERKPIVLDKDPDQYDVPFTQVPNTSDIIMYEVNLKAFSSQGNLKGVQARLDLIKDLGINVIWLMPIYPEGELRSVGSPYSIKNYKEVNPNYGNLEDLRTLVKEAHARGMAVILDWVANHTAWDHPWIQNKSWYTQDAAGNIVSPNGWNDVADLNFNSGAMRKEMIKAMKYWVLAANVDGYRCDYADGVPFDFWKQAIDTLKNIPNRKLVLFAEGTRTDNFSAGFSLTFGWNFFGTLKDIFNKNENTSRLAGSNASEYSGLDVNSHILRFTSNHDDNAVDNAPFATFKGKQGSMAAFAATLLMGGVPLIYSGQEVGTPVKLSFFTRTPIDWSINPDITAEYKKLIAFRKGSPAIKNGSIVYYNNNPNIVAFKRTMGTEQVVVLVNVRETPVTYSLDPSFANTTWSNALTNTSTNLGTQVSLAPFEYLILKK